MRITEEDIKYTASLAKLEVKEEKVSLFTKQIGDIVDFANQLNEVDTSDVDADAYLLPKKNVWREDKIKDSLSREDILLNAKSKEAGYITVSKVVE